MDKYIYINSNSLSKEICSKIIYLFEHEEKKYCGITQQGTDKNIKDTLDYIINKNCNKWQNIYELLEKELEYNILEYIDSITKNINYLEIEKSNIKYKLFSSNRLVNYNGFLMQKYKKENGRYIYHDDSAIDYPNKKCRVITFIWYLNNIEEGGETEFWGTHKIIPETGKLLLFPACWTFPHRGKIPISDNKYIITGWLYIDNN
jgi:hypothetical protein